MATISNITIDLSPQSDQTAQSPCSPPSLQQNTEPPTPRAHKDGKKKRRSDVLVPKSPPSVPSKSVMSVNSQTSSNQDNSDLLLADKPAVSESCDTMELLREADISDFNVQGEKVEDLCRNGKEESQENKLLIENDLGDGSKDNTEVLLKGVEMERQSPELQTNLESTEKLLEPQPLVQFPVPRPLPVPPVDSLVHHKRNRHKVVPAPTPVSEGRDGATPPLQQGRPLSARERRRLRQSQEAVSHSALNPARRSSYDVSSSKTDREEVQVSRSVSVPITERTEKQQEKSDEEDFSSSTSSTDCSVGDAKERKESSDMQDLVQMMTQTLRMDGGDAEGSRDLQEFRLNRRYRDTLLLHGKTRQEPKDLSLSHINMETTSGPAKVRRAVEQLRTDALKGLGVKLLDKVLEIMEEEDETKREVCLRDQMGDEKYQAYAVMVRQLKFFEDMALKV
uniref:Uncharacterized protein n=1 Tax=Neogobius melanostomus TaxID=47308 RepID=A0A8C6SDE8_9GOBI